MGLMRPPAPEHRAAGRAGSHRRSQSGALTPLFGTPGLQRGDEWFCVRAAQERNTDPISKHTRLSPTGQRTGYSHGTRPPSLSTVPDVESVQPQQLRTTSRSVQTWILSNANRDAQQAPEKKVTNRRQQGLCLRGRGGEGPGRETGGRLEARRRLRGCRLPESLPGSAAPVGGARLQTAQAGQTEGLLASELSKEATGVRTAGTAGGSTSTGTLSVPWCGMASDKYMCMCVCR